MDDYFIRILRLTSYIKQHLIRYVEGFLFGDCERLSHDPQISLSRYDEGSIGSKSKSPHGDCSMGRHSVDIAKHEDLSLNEGSKTSVVRRARILICQGLMLPLHGLRLGLRLASACVRYSCLYVRSIQKEVSGFLCRVRRTLLGSSKEIGWLQRTEGLPPVVDGTNRFMEVLHDVRSGKHRLPNSLVYLLIPGLFSNHSPLYFVNTKRFFSKMGLTSHIAKIHSESSVEKNAWELKQYIEELFWGSGKKVLLLGHSKGGVDAAAALSMYWSDLKDKVAGLALVQSPYGGSPIAADILREGQIADKEARRVMVFIVCKLIKGDMTALEDLTYEKRKDFITKHVLPAEEVPLISFHTEAGIAPGVLATMSLIAHAELPGIPFPSFLKDYEIESCQGGRKVPIVMPLAAAMAVSALHLRLRYAEPSDGLVTRRDAEVPGSIVVRPDRKLHHAWMVCSPMTKDEVEADASEMCEALLTMLVEIGKRKEKSRSSGTNHSCEFEQEGLKGLSPELKVV